MSSGTGADHARITYIGGPTALIEIGPARSPLRLLTDPTFEPAGYRYASGSQAIVKTVSPALPVAALGPLDAVLLSHDQHGDNLDPAGRAALVQARETLTTPEGAHRLGGNARGLATWETVRVVGADGLAVHVTAVPARHGPAEIAAATGTVTGWLLQWEGQRRGALYISGDTVLFEGLEEIARRHTISIALLHFGAARVQRFGPAFLTLTGVEGASFARRLGQATIVPLHFEGWTHYTEGRAAIESAFAAAGTATDLRFLPPGQATALAA